MSAIKSFSAAVAVAPRADSSGFGQGVAQRLADQDAALKVVALLEKIVELAALVLKEEAELNRGSNRAGFFRGWPPPAPPPPPGAVLDGSLQIGLWFPQIHRRPAVRAECARSDGSMGGLPLNLSLCKH